MQRVTPNIVDAFGPAKKAIWESFMSSLFQGVGEGMPGREVTLFPVKEEVLDLPDPILKAPEKWTDSCVITEQLITSLRG